MPNPAKAAAHGAFQRCATTREGTPQAAPAIRHIALIKLLEDTLGVELFERKGRAIEPNEQAILLAHYVQSAFDELTEGVRRVTKTGPKNRINLNASPYFATRYLLDRLAAFRDTMPDADLRLTTMVELPDFVSDEVDVAVQWGFGGWRQYESTLLLQDFKQICCTPDMARKIAGPADLLDLPLLHPVLAEGLWGDVLRHLGVEAADNPGGIRFQDAATMRRATVAGLGVGLISTIDAEEDLKLGKLVAPLGRDIMQGMPGEQVPGFYLVLPRAHRRLKPIAAFCAWVEGENWRQLGVQKF